MIRIVATLFRYKCRITSGVIGNAAMNFYFTAATVANQNAVKTLIDSLKLYMPNTVTYVIPGSGDAVYEDTGKLAGGWSVGTDQTVSGSGSNAYPGQAGGMIKWSVGAVVDSHRPVGRTILVPLSSPAFSTTGGLIAGFVTAAQSAAAAFLSTSSGFVVWHRPVYDYKVKPAVLVRPGQGVPVTGASVPSVSSTLRSRNH